MFIGYGVKIAIKFNNYFDIAYNSSFLVGCKMIGKRIMGSPN